MKTYKIGEISKMLGISSETIRNYEKKGLIRPCKDEYSNYRYFDIIQINHLLNIQRFHKYGYSLQEVGDIMQQTSMANLEMSLENKEAELINEAFYMNLHSFCYFQYDTGAERKTGMLFREAAGTVPDELPEAV